MRLLGLVAAAIGGALIGFLLGLGVANAAPRGGSDTEGSPALLGASHGEPGNLVGVRARGECPVVGMGQQTRARSTLSAGVDERPGDDKPTCPLREVPAVIAVAPPSDVPTDASRWGAPVSPTAASQPASSDVSMSAPIRGTATWYCSPTSNCTRGYGPSDLVAAIDPSLGIPKGTWLRVTHGGRSVEVRVVDVCACDGARIIDLTSGAFLRLAPLSRGVIQVSIEVLAPHATLPATDAEAGE